MPISEADVPITAAALQGIFTSSGCADAYGIPQTIVETLVRCNQLVDLFPYRFDNQPVKPADLLTNIQGTQGDGSFAEGGCPDDVEHDECRIVFTAKSFGRASPKQTYVALASKQHPVPATRQIVTAGGVETFSDEWDYTMYLVLTAVRQALEWLVINGNPLTNANNFEGLDRLIRDPVGGRLDVNGIGCPDANSEVMNMAGSYVSVDDLYQMFGALQANGVDPTDIILVMRPGMANEIARLISLNYADPGAKREEIMGSSTFPLYGQNVPYRTTQCIDATGSGDSYTSTIFFLTFNYRGMPHMWLEFFDFSKIVLNSDLFAAPAGTGGLAPSPFVMVTADKGDYCTSFQYAIWAHGRVFTEAPFALGKMQNVAYTFHNVRTRTRP